MIEPKLFYHLLAQRGTTFFTGVPDSLLKHFCAHIAETADENSHILAANEGCAVALAAGHYLATGNIPLVYMQNSGLGNATNPLLSLVDGDVYGIPLVLLIGWRGQPGVPDEPQHGKQGKVTLSLLDAMGISYGIMSNEPETLAAQVATCYEHMSRTQSPYALVVPKNTFASCKPVTLFTEEFPLSRERAIEIVMLNAPENGIVVSTTGMASRELYELREKHGMGHEKDFLTVGSMGHASQIALAIALEKSDRHIICIDGDGALLMHMGGIATIGTHKPLNFTHIVINNGAHDSVGGQPTAGRHVDLPAIATACGYRNVATAATEPELFAALQAQRSGPMLLEVRVKKGSRNNLGRPKETPVQNKVTFMRGIVSA